MEQSTEARRNRFFRGKRMQVEEFRIEQAYAIERRRLINRAVLGWGVVQGFALSQPDAPATPEGDHEDAPAAGQAAAAQMDTAPTESRTESAPSEPQALPYPLSVGAGIAFDRAGHEVVHHKDAELNKTNTFVRASNAQGELCAQDLSTLKSGDYILAVHYAEEKAGALVSTSFCGCSRPERGFVVETAVFSLRAYDGKCPCGQQGCAGDDGHECFRDACKRNIRGPHARLSHWITKRRLGHESHPHCWGHYEIWLHETIDLACVSVEPGERECDPPRFIVKDPSGPRRLVKNNDLLFDLLRGCDLTTIKEVNWKDDLHRKIDPRANWDVFASYFTDAGLSEGRTKFEVTFSHPVKTKTLLRDVVTMTAYFLDSGTGWRNGLRVPITELESIPTRPLPAGLTDRFRIVVRKDWITDEINPGGKSYFDEGNFYVELEIRGDLVEDCSGLMVSASNRGLHRFPTGNGVPGGTFVSSFRVTAKPKSPGSIENE